MSFFSPRASRRRAKADRLSRRFSPGPNLEQLEQRHLLAAVLLVDDDGAQFQDAQFDSIQAAVDAADPGDVIRVAPGIYAESVRVETSLTIQGAFASAAEAKNPREASIVDPPGSQFAALPAFDLLANDIAIQGFSIGDYNGDAAIEASAAGSIGVRTSPNFSGYRVTNSTIQENTVGIDFASSGEIGSKIKNNTIRNNNLGFDDLTRAGNGILSDRGASNFTIRGNIIVDQLVSAIALTGPAGDQENIFILSNAVGDSNRDNSGAAIVLENVVDATVSENVLENSRTHGIEIRGASNSLLIEENVIRSAALMGIEQAAKIRFDGEIPSDTPAIPFFLPPTTAELSNTIRGNRISGSGQSGIHLNSTSGTQVIGNVVTGSQGDGAGGGHGIEVENSSRNRLESNVLSANARTGISVDATSTLNKMKTNSASGNGRFDYEDLSIGNMTAETANVWTRNRGSTQNRPGLIG